MMLANRWPGSVRCLQGTTGKAAAHMHPALLTETRYNFDAL
jgi:hypothetical protein